MEYDFEANFGQTEPSLKSRIIEFVQTFVVFLAVGTVIYLLIAQPHKVSGSSMYPTLIDGNYIITNKLGYRFAQPQRGEIIVFKNPREESQDFIKRIIAIPDDRIKLENEKIFLNGRPLEEDYLNPSVTTIPGNFIKEGEEIIVPDNKYVVFGDNRTKSSDSRSWGFITKDEIIGKAFFRYWPLQLIGFIGQS